MKKLISLFLVMSVIISIAPSISHAATFSNQDVTVYVGGSKTYHGTNPRQYFTVAVGPKTCGNARSGTLFPFGSDIVPTRSISTPGGNKTLFNVEDMGNVNCSRNLTRQFFDVYFGSGTMDNITRANNFGKKKITYNVYR